VVPSDRRPGEVLALAITDLDDIGGGVGAWSRGQESLRVHVAGALPGERVTVRLAHVSAHAQAGGREAWADLLDVQEASADRVSPVCPAYGSCGGCALMAASQPLQLARKRQRLTSELGRHADLVACAVDDCVASPLSLGYRNQAKFVYARPAGSGPPVFGAYAPRTHRVVDLAGCRVVEPIIEEVRRFLLDILVAAKVEPFHETRQTGILRYAVLRATSERRVLVTLVVARSPWDAGEGLAQALASACPAVHSVVLNLNPSAGNRIFGEVERVLVGPGFVDDRVGDVTVRLSSRSFFQTNRHVAARIYRDLVAAAPSGIARAVDVYAGAAPIALSLARHVEEVVAIEENPAATAAAAAAIAEHGGVAGRVRMVTGDAAEGMAQIAAADLVVLNPPRKGCAAQVLRAVARLRPRCLAYVSCDPGTLARDLAVLVAGGGRLERLVPYDMMPHTPHVESLAHLTFA
jgi:23S rRNA (uracil1939-C5)-methyltransferase